MDKKVSKVRKRDGRIVTFNQSKITNAILKALNATKEVESSKINDLVKKLSNEVVSTLNKKFHPRSIPAIEEIQDIVEDTLVKNHLTKTVRAYIIYREQHAQMREMQKLVDPVKLVSSYLNLEDWRVKENSNMAFSLQGLNNYIASLVTAAFWLNKIYPKEIKEAHQNGDFHIHDLQLLAAYCCGWDLKDLLIKGFKGAPGKVESRPAKHLRSALGQVVNFFYTLQGEVAGAQAFSNFDTFLSPFIRYDNLTYKEVKQNLQEFVFNTNVPTRVGFQSPFTNITLDLQPPDIIKNENVIIGGKPQKEKYKDFQKEMDMFNRAFAEVMIEGDAKQRPFTFPIPTYNITKDFDWSNKNLKGLWEMTAKYGIPYFSNFINSDMKPEDARSMCCRLRLDNRELRKRGGGLFGANPKTGSIGVVTINMARLGFLAKNEKDYFKKLDKLMNLAKESLELKRKFLERLTDQGLFPYCRFYLSDIKQRFGQYWKNHFSTIGLNGMNESCLNFLHKDIASKEGKELTNKVLDFMREKLMDFQIETNNLYNLEATPAEGTTYRFAMGDKEQFPKIIVANEKEYKKGAAPYYTNSTHLPVGYTDDIFEALKLQDEFQVKYSGGTVLHGFLGERLENGEVVKKLVKKIAQNFHLPYFTLTPTFSICPSCGYLNGEVDKCPNCKSKTEIYSRVVGYLRPISQWNKGKRSEFANRREYKV